MLILSIAALGSVALILTGVALLWGMWHWPPETEGPREILLATAGSPHTARKQRRSATRLPQTLVVRRRVNGTDPLDPRTSRVSPVSTFKTSRFTPARMRRAS